MTIYILLLVTFVLSHIGLTSSAFRRPMVARLGETGFQLVYSLISVILLAAAISLYRQQETQILWQVPHWAFWDGSFFIWIASILFVGSLSPRNKALAGRERARPEAVGVMRITRHPMMWAFAIWAVVHMTMSGNVPLILLAGAILALSLFGAAHQDHKKFVSLGRAWLAYEAQTSFWPLGAQISKKQPWRSLWPGWPVFWGGTLLWLLTTYVHPVLMKGPIVPPWGGL